MTKTNKMKYAIITTLLCLMLLPIIMCGVTFCAPAEEDGVLVKYYATNGDVVKTERFTNGTELAGIPGYDGKYQINTHKDKEKYLSFIVPDEEYVAANFREPMEQSSYPGRYYIPGRINKDKNIREEDFFNNAEASKNIYCLETYCGTKYSYGGYSGAYCFYFSLSNIFGFLPSDINQEVSVSFDQSTHNYTYKRHGESDQEFLCTIGFSIPEIDHHDLDYYESFYDAIGKTYHVSEIKMKDTQKYIYYNNTFDSIESVNAISNLNEIAQENEINVYTDYVAEPVITPGDPDSEKPGTSTPAGQASGVKANIEALKTQWNALKMGDFKAAKGWQLISTASAVAVASIALVVSLWIGAAKITKMSRKAKYRRRK